MAHRQSLAPNRNGSSKQSQQSQPQPPQTSLIGYPILKTVEIVDCLQELHVPIQEEDINRPNAQSIQTAWAILLESFNGVTIEGFERPKGALLGMMQYPELLNDAVTFQMFFAHVRRLVKVAGVDNFTIQDLTRPEAPRVRDCFSGVINFAKFKLSHQGLFDELVSKGDEINARRQQLDEEYRTLQYQLQDLKEQKASDIPRIEAATARNDAIRLELQALKKEQTALTAEVARLDDVKKGLKEQIQTHSAQTQSLQTDISSARSRLVQSPDRLKRTIAELARSNNNEKAVLASFTKKARELGVKLEQIGGLEQDVRSLIEIQREAEAEQQRMDQAQARLTSLQHDYSKAVVAQTSTSTRLEQLQTQLTNASDKLTRAQHSWVEKKDRFRSSIARLREEYALVLKERDEDEQALREREKEIGRIQAETDEWVAQNQAEVNALMAEYWRLRAHVEAYMAEMKMKLGLKEVKPQLQSS